MKIVKPNKIGLITFGLMCIICFVVCIGLIVATAAGIAYGYNYSMAEFITFSPSDVTVFMRRGEFQDDPNVEYRRSGNADIFPANISTDYEDHKIPAESKPLGDTWLKTQDTRKYAEILTRYNPNKAEFDEPEVPQSSAFRESPSQAPLVEIQIKPTPDAPIISIVPNALMPTVSWRSGSSKIMMRNFQPLEDYTTINLHPGRPETLFPTRSTEPQSISILNPKKHAKGYGNIRDDFSENYVPMRVWGTTTRAVIPDDPDDVDEDNIVYKPV